MVDLDVAQGSVGAEEVPSGIKFRCFYAPEISLGLVKQIIVTPGTKMVIFLYGSV